MGNEEELLHVALRFIPYALFHGVGVGMEINAKRVTQLNLLI